MSPAKMRRQGWALIVAGLCLTSITQLSGDGPLAPGVDAPQMTELGMAGLMVVGVAGTAAMIAMAYGYAGFRSYLVNREGLTGGAWVLSVVKWMCAVVSALLIAVLLVSVFLGWRLASIQREIDALEAGSDAVQETGPNAPATSETGAPPEPTAAPASAATSEPEAVEPANPLLTLGGAILGGILFFVLALNVQKLPSTLFGLKQGYVWTLVLQVVMAALFFTFTPIVSLVFLANHVIMGMILLRAADAEAVRDPAGAGLAFSADQPS
jgi:hypothetical protein